MQCSKNRGAPEENSCSQNGRETSAWESAWESARECVRKCVRKCVRTCVKKCVKKCVRSAWESAWDTAWESAWEIWAIEKPSHATFHATSHTLCLARRRTSWKPLEPVGKSCNLWKLLESFCTFWKPLQTASTSCVETSWNLPENSWKLWEAPGTFWNLQAWGSNFHPISRSCPGIKIQKILNQYL